MDKLEELKEKVAKDPSSKLFVPLADEYRKAGMFEEAISVLKDGLERQPNYTSARVALGKIYLEQDMLDEAEAEFEGVVASAPDNLFAQRKLADIFKRKGERERAVEQYKRVIKLNPLDEEAQVILRELTNVPFAADELADEEFLLSLSLAEEPPAEELTAVEEAAEAVGEEEAMEEEVFLEEFEKALPEEVMVEALEEAGVIEEASPVETEAVETLEEAETVEETASAEEEGGAAEEVAPLEEEVEEVEAVEEAVEAVPLEEAGEAFDETGFHDIGLTEVAEEYSEEHRARELVADGEYAEALNIYRKLIAEEPENKKALQGLQELESLLKLLGREKEMVVAKLKVFLKAVMKRRDEFYRHA